MDRRGRSSTRIPNSLVPTLITFALIGCSASSPEPDLSAILSRRPEPASQPARSYDFDFGTVLARGQDLKHEFRWVNRGDRPLKVVGSKVNVPCCSRLGELPGLIPPGGSAVVAVFLKAGRVADQKRVTFDIETDAPSEPMEVFTLVARFVPEWEIQESSGRPTSLLVGQAASRSYRLIGRRKAGEGRSAPAKLAPGVKPEVEIATDDLDQPLLKLGVLVAPRMETAP